MMEASRKCSARERKAERVGERERERERVAKVAPRRLSIVTAAARSADRSDETRARSTKPREGERERERR
jgi:hypothetical protein